MNRKNKPLKKYRMQVGFWEVRVNARSADEAILVARRHLGHELPHLYDAIHASAVSRFQVEATA